MGTRDHRGRPMKHVPGFVWVSRSNVLSVTKQLGPAHLPMWRDAVVMDGDRILSTRAWLSLAATVLGACISNNTRDDGEQGPRYDRAGENHQQRADRRWHVLTSE